MDEVTQNASWTTYFVEGYRPGESVETLRRSARRLRAAAERMARDGELVRYVRATIIPDDESCLVLFEAASEDLVRTAYARAHVHFERISAAVHVEEIEPERRRNR